MSDGFLGLGDLRVPQVTVGEQRGAPGGRKRHSSSWVDGEFLRGPVPLSWLGRAFVLPGKNVVLVALAIWFEAGRRDSRERLKLTSAILGRFGVTDRSAKYRALLALEEAGLIRVERRPRANPLVTILDGGETSAVAG
nr:hypothetical protein [uncultured bacterium]